jgi:hypothetical protein
VASKRELPGQFRVGDRVVAYGWRDDLEWETVGTVVHAYLSAIDGPTVVVLGDVPEPDGSAMFDRRTADVELLDDPGRIEGQR